MNNKHKMMPSVRAGSRNTKVPAANGANLSGVEQASRLLFSPRGGSRDGRPTSQTPLKLAPFAPAAFSRGWLTGTKWQILAIMGLLILGFSPNAMAMHISEGILPVQWAGLWFLVAIPFVLWGLHDFKVRSAETPYFKPLVGLVGAAVFIISCMPIPVPTAGTCSHPCGTGMAAILIGPGLTVVVTSIALLLQALFLSHGGLTTLGANIVSMGVIGGFVGYGTFHLARRLGLPFFAAAFLAGLFSDWGTYTGTSFLLASALHGDGSLWVMFASIIFSFCPTQIPLGILEGFLTAGAFAFIRNRRPEVLGLHFKARGGAL